MIANKRDRVSPLVILIAVGLALLASVLIFNSYSAWIAKNGGLASWLQAVGSLYAIVAVSFPVFLERRATTSKARRSVLMSAQMACELMNTVASRAFESEARFSEWWVPQWHIIDDVMASCPVHELDSAEALNAFVTIRELYGRMRSWDETSSDPWPRNDDNMMSYVGVLCMNARSQLDRLQSCFK